MRDQSIYLIIKCSKISYYKKENPFFRKCQECSPKWKTGFIMIRQETEERHIRNEHSVPQLHF